MLIWWKNEGMHRWLSTVVWFAKPIDFSSGRRSVKGPVRRSGIFHWCCRCWSRFLFVRVNSWIFNSWLDTLLGARVCVCVCVLCTCAGCHLFGSFCRSCFVWPVASPSAIVHRRPHHPVFDPLFRRHPVAPMPGGRRCGRMWCWHWPLQFQAKWKDLLNCAPKVCT